MIFTSFLLLIAAAQTCVGLVEPHRFRVEVPSNVRNTGSVWQKMMPRHETKPVKKSVYKGTEPQPEDAGVSRVDIHSRIINGKVAERGQFPWQVVITADQNQMCSGSLISDQWVLTAAHCVYQLDTFTVALGATNTWFNESGVVRITTRTKVVHPEFDQGFNNNIAALRLPSPVVSNTYISAVRLPRASQVGNDFVGSVARVSGWGITEGDGEENSKYLNFVDVNITSNTECVSWLGQVVTASNICTVGDDGKNPCKGDTGGPLVIQENDGRYTLVGVVSFGARHCAEYIPAAYSRVTSFLEWISSTTNIAIAD